MRGFSHRRLSRLLLVLATFAAMPAASAQPLVSFFPHKGLGHFLANNFDLASIRSSFGPRRTPATRTFAAFDMAPTKVTDDILEFDEPTWYYGIRVLRRADINSDGIEDLEICFIDKAKEGSYDAQQALLVTRYSASTYAVAISYQVDGCEKFAR